MLLGYLQMVATRRYKSVNAGDETIRDTLLDVKPCLIVLDGLSQQPDQREKKGLWHSENMNMK